MKVSPVQVHSSESKYKILSRGPDQSPLYVEDTVYELSLPHSYADEVGFLEEQSGLTAVRWGVKFNEDATEALRGVIGEVVGYEPPGELQQVKLHSTQSYAFEESPETVIEGRVTFTQLLTKDESGLKEVTDEVLPDDISFGSDRTEAPWQEELAEIFGQDGPKGPQAAGDGKESDVSRPFECPVEGCHDRPEDLHDHAISTHGFWNPDWERGSDEGGNRGE